MKVLILGSTGLLGSAVGKHFLAAGHDVTLTYRNPRVRYGHTTHVFDALSHPLETLPTGFEYVINCIGVIKPLITSSAGDAFVNAVFPHRLARWCRDQGGRLLHISTDCVFSGTTGNYDETYPCDCLDFYGRSKAFGEPSQCMVLRTSVIGEELHKRVSLVEWTKAQRGRVVKGYINHYWNGITARQCAFICEQIIQQGYYQEGVFHVFGDVVTKYQMLEAFNHKWRLRLTIVPHEHEQAVNRSLTTVKMLNSALRVPSFTRMMEQMP